MKKRHLLYSLLIMLLLIVALAGWFATKYLGNRAREAIIRESQASVLTLSIYVSVTLNNIEGAVKSLAGSPWITPALMSKRKRDIEQAESALDRYNSAISASVSYLINADGMTVAASNRNDSDSFLGKSYRFRPYFQEAAKGQPGRYFGLGVTSGKRGFYASCPVQNLMGKVLGVVVMKKELDEMETFFSKYPYCFLISPEGIIFLSSKPAMVLKSIWPVDKAEQDKLIVSQQFGSKVSEAVFKEEIADGMEVVLEGNHYFVSRKVIDGVGWSIVLLTPKDRIDYYRWIGILATLSVCFLIVIFSVVIYATERSREAIRQGEESKHLLLHAAGDGIFGVDAKGVVTFVNAAALRMLGFSEEEMLGHGVHSLIHFAHEDGSDYPMEDCPMYASYTKAIDSHVTNEILWRKDGRSFPVEYSSMPIIKNGKIMGAVVTFQDITARKQIEEKLRKSEERYRVIIEQIEDGYFETDLRGAFTFVNDAECRNLGYPREMMLGMKAKQYTDEKAAKVLYKIFMGVYKTGVPVKAHDVEIIQKDGTKSCNQISVSLLRNSKGESIGFRGISRDVTERKRLEEALKKSEAMLNEMGRTAKVGGWELDVASQKQVWTKEVYSIHEVDESYEPTGSEGIAFYVPESRPAMRKAVQCAIDYGEPFDVELEIMTAKGNRCWVHASGKAHRENGLTTKVFGIFQDITERKQAEEAIRQMAYHDTLTGLPNRKLFSDRLGIVLAQSQRDQKKAGIMMLDLDNFKGVNDTLGHDVGDLLLKAAAERLGAALRRGDTVARFGGDEFVLIIPDLKAIEDAIQVAQKIVDSFCKPFLINSHQLVVTTSIGIAFYPDDGTDEGILLKNADIAMYQAKQAGRGRYRLCCGEEELTAFT